ncbi:YsnF/AvaK domain-containing protein [Priestia abyssalis]|uniref:YsnF/AvaK domain-containing protein n=1 Tax=Priestia abyssalis TaxID=1221450 RepID=UPI00099572C0|nr:YsnF/AvaK domain-containing protein [Priestia abyssalis]
MRMGKRIVGTYYSEKETLDVIESLKRQGHRETDIMVVANKRSEIPLVAAQAGVMIEADPQVNTLTGVMMDSFFTMMTGKRAGLAASLMARGIPDFTAKRCEAEAAKGKILVLVDTDITYDSLNDMEAPYGTEEEKALRLHEERLDVVKERVQVGELQVWKEVMETEQAIQVPLTHEEVYVERRSVIDGQYDGVSIGDNEVIRIPIIEERIEVTKRPVVVEEIIIGKRKVQKTKEVRDIVMKEEARIERSVMPTMESSQIKKDLLQIENTMDSIPLSIEETQNMASVTDGQKEDKSVKRTGSLNIRDNSQSEKTKKEETSENKTESSNDKSNKKTPAATQKKEEVNRSSEDSSKNEENKNDRTQINKVKK